MEQIHVTVENEAALIWLILYKSLNWHSGLDISSWAFLIPSRYAGKAALLNLTLKYSFTLKYNHFVCLKALTC